REARGEGRVVDDGARPAGGEHEAQLVGDVAVVDVDEGGTRVERAEHRLEPLGAVVGVDGDVVVAGLPGLEGRAPDAAAEAQAAERAADAARAREELRIGEDPVAPHERLALRDVSAIRSCRRARWTSKARLSGP